MPQNSCPIWGLVAVDSPMNSDARRVTSERAGGTFEISGTAAACLTRLSYADRAKLSLWILEQNLLERDVSIDTDDLTRIESSRLLSITERLNLLMKVLQKKTGLGQRTDGFSATFQAAIGSESSPNYQVIRNGERFDPVREVFQFWRHAESEGLVELTPIAGQRARVSLTIKGHTHLDNLGPRLVDSEQIFVAMWFSEKTRELYENVIKPSVLAAGYVPVRIDDTQHNEKIDDQIIAEIRRSKAVIVDITCGLAEMTSAEGEKREIGAPRGGVYYEAGFAKGLNLPVIWMVEKNTADVENVSHFDVRQFNQIRWLETELSVAQEILEARIKATLGQGPNPL